MDLLGIHTIRWYLAATLPVLSRPLKMRIGRPWPLDQTGDI